MRWDEDLLPAVVPVGPRRLGKQHARRWVRSPHLYNNGNLCVAALDDWDTAAHTAADVAAWAAHWLAVFTAWRITDRWLVEGFAGDVAV